MVDKISQADGRMLLELARNTIADKLSRKGGGAEPDPRLPADLLARKSGVFVTLHKSGRLRGCIGNIEPKLSLLEGIQSNARHAAFHDSRFQPVTAGEFGDIDIEISVLTPPKKMDYTDVRDMMARLTPQKDGVIVEKSRRRATFLPQVWEQLPSPEAFLTQLCQKAGLHGNEWETGELTLYTYQVQSFAELSEL